MRRKHHVIYVPGILDNVYGIQGLCVKTWRLYGVYGHTHVMPWAGAEKYEPKFQRLLDQIDQYAADGHTVSLVGASAGASAVLNAFVERSDKVSGVVVLCPKINGPETVGKKTYDENPAFKTALYGLQDNLKQLTPEQRAKRLLMYYSPKDGTIPYAGSAMSGVPERRLPPLKHGYAIVYAISFGARRLLSFLKSV